MKKGIIWLMKVDVFRLQKYHFVNHILEQKTQHNVYVVKQVIILIKKVYVKKEMNLN